MKEKNIQTDLSDTYLREMFNWLFEKAEPLKDRADIRELIADWWVAKIKEIREAERLSVLNYVKEMDYGFKKYELNEYEVGIEGGFEEAKERLINWLANQPL